MLTATASSRCRSSFPLPRPAYRCRRRRMGLCLCVAPCRRPDAATHHQGGIHLVQCLTPERTQALEQTTLIDGEELGTVHHRWRSQAPVRRRNDNRHRIGAERRRNRRNDSGGCILVANIILQDEGLPHALLFTAPARIEIDEPELPTPTD